MAKPETSAPRGTNKVVKAFFETLDSTPDAGRSQVAKAALAAIREKLTARKDKEKATREKEKAKSARGKAAPSPRKAASSSRTANARKPPAAAAKPARSTKAPDASAPKATKWTCPALTDTPDRLNGLRGVDGGEQQTAPVVSGRVQARGGGCDPQRPLGFGGGGRAWFAGPAGTDLAALGGGSHSGREQRAGA